MHRRASLEIRADLRARLETARLDLLALFRALDRMNLTPEQIPAATPPTTVRTRRRFCGSSLGAGSTTGEIQLACYAPRYAGCAGAVTSSLLALSQKPSAHGLLHSRPTRTHNPQKPEHSRGIQHGPRPEPPKRLSTRQSSLLDESCKLGMPQSESGWFSLELLMTWKTTRVDAG